MHTSTARVWAGGELTAPSALLPPPRTWLPSLLCSEEDTGAWLGRPKSGGGSSKARARQQRAYSGLHLGGSRSPELRGAAGTQLGPHPTRQRSCLGKCAGEAVSARAQCGSPSSSSALVSAGALCGWPREATRSDTAALRTHVLRYEKVRLMQFRALTHRIRTQYRTMNHHQQYHAQTSVKKPNEQPNRNKTLTGRDGRGGCLQLRRLRR